MELNEDGFLEELLALRREAWETNPSTEINGFFSTTTWGFDGLDSAPTAVPPSSILPNSTSYDSFSPSIHEPTSLDCTSFSNFYAPSLLSPPEHHSLEPSPFSGPGPEPGEYSMSIMEDEMPCKAEPSLSSGEMIPSSSFNIGLCMERSTNNSAGTPTSSAKSKAKKVEGQPSKNLMAERRRRKRLNDRLSMLRSVVPKISKMDRTSILGDTIDYMKELLERINNLQEEADVGSNQLNVMSIFKDVKPNDVLVRNSPKFDVERRNLDTRVEICCAGKPGLLLSTVTTLEALGLEIQQCVLSCFNEFSLQASCSEELEQRSLLSSEDVKQALFRNAGYGGRCL